jgi:hypothetical protein
MMLVGSDDQGTTQRYIDTEATGEIRNSMIGWGGAALVRQLHESTGEQKVVSHGKDSAGNIDPLRTNADMQQQVEVVGSTIVPTARGVLGRADLAITTDTAVYTVAASTTAEVNIFVCNRNAIPVDVRLALSDGAVANEDYIFYDYTIGAYGSLEVVNVVLNAADVVRAYSDTADVSVVVSGTEYGA